MITNNERYLPSPAGRGAGGEVFSPLGEGPGVRRSKSENQLIIDRCKLLVTKIRYLPDKNFIFHFSLFVFHLLQLICFQEL
jgi:hypothetical protein